MYPTMQPLLLSFVFLVTERLQPLQASMEMLIYIRSEGDAIYALDIPNNITAADLYQRVLGMRATDLLYFGGIEISKFDDRDIADLSISPQSVLHIIRHRPTDSEALYQFAKDLGNRECIAWWEDVLECHESPEKEECRQHSVCQWNGIQCNAAQNATVHVSILSMPMARVSGIIIPRKLPKTVVVLEGSYQQINGVDLRGLRDHDLERILLYENNIEHIEFENDKELKGELRGSSLKNLDLSGNKISDLDFNKLPRGLESLDLSNNLLSFVNLSALPSKLRSLDLTGNQIYTLTHDDFMGLECYSSLTGRVTQVGGYPWRIGKTGTRIKLDGNPVLFKILDGYQGCDARVHTLRRKIKRQRPRRNYLTPNECHWNCCRAQ